MLATQEKADNSQRTSDKEDNRKSYLTPLGNATAVRTELMKAKIHKNT